MNNEEQARAAFVATLDMQEELINVCSTFTAHLPDKDLQILVSALALEAAMLACRKTMKESGSAFGDAVYQTLRQEVFVGTVLGDVM